MENLFKDKTILVTGGTGSIGSEIVRQLLQFEPRAIRILARHEDRHYSVMQELGVNHPRLRFIIGDVRDKDRLRMAMEGVDIVFHAAALKQVPMCEYNPFEAVKTNILGTQNVIEVARDLGVDRVIGISTDKVVDPQGVMGVSKLMAEKLFLSTYYYRGDKQTKFACVRFGNVLGSRGSVLPVWKKQIAGNGEITLMDPKMTRFFMTIPQAVRLVLDAAHLSVGHEIFILKMPAAKMGDLAKAAVSYYAPRVGKKTSAIKIKVVGKREGDKIHEALIDDHELGHALETKTMYILTPMQQVWNQKYHEVYPGAKKISDRKAALLSHRVPQLSHAQIVKLIDEVEQQLAHEV